ncbi:MAG: ABC transporter ATP-binding protein [Candidatus Omnitrophica bacterium]|nr:ABC transporter ATP-binding protein [Candidatus Omnitrophota bacterium]
MNAIEFNSVWKKFRKGEKFNSLRDAIPDFFKRKAPNVKLEDKEFWAVKDVSFNIEKGGVIGIMGPNGAGKSTILKLLSRIIVPNKGSMKINGRLSALIEVTAGFHPELTGRENVYLNATILGMRKKEIDDKFEDIVEFSGVREFIDTPVKRYSSGMYSRLGFSVAAHMDPDILLVDEVLAVGDMAFRAKCAQKIRELLGSGATIVLVSHQLDMIQSLCKRVLLLQNGEVIRDGNVEDVIPHYQNIVSKESEDALRQKMTALSKRVQVDTRSLVEMTEVTLSAGKGKSKEKIEIGDTVEVALDYETREKIDDPIFTVAIIRADGVLCCSSRSDETGAKAGTIEGKGKVKINLGKLILAPGIYMLKLSVWDKDMIHAYAVRNKDVIRVETDTGRRQTEAVFLPDITWEFK